MRQAGAYNVSGKLQADSAVVGDDWIVRKNPDAIVKFVSSDILGAGVSGSAAASEVKNEILSREGFSDLPAVREGRVILLSEELLESESLQTAAALAIAKCLYPDSFEDADSQEALAQLQKESGAPEGGVFVLEE